MVRVQVLNLVLDPAAATTNPEIFKKSPDFSKSAVAVDAEPHDDAELYGSLGPDGLVSGSHEHAAAISEVKLKPSAGIKTLLEKEPRRVRIVNLDVYPGRLSESVAVMEADLYRPGAYPVRIRCTTDPEAAEEVF